jgi:hypothetical protein
MKQPLEFKLYYGNDLVFSCFAFHLGEAIEQLNECEGDSFEVSSISAAKFAANNGEWQHCPLPKLNAVINHFNK